jgi:hypothetical protein
MLCRCYSDGRLTEEILLTFIYLCYVDVIYFRYERSSQKEKLSLTFYAMYM